MDAKTALLIIISSSLFSCARADVREIAKIYADAGVDGSFLMLDVKAGRYTRINPELSRTGLLPASTFKIINSLIALEEGIVPDENCIIKWDGTDYGLPWLNQDHSLRSAYRNSAVWFYQILAREIGMARMRRYLGLLGYGNGDTSAGIDQFWIQGGFRVSMEQQIELLKRLHEGRLPFSKRTMGIVRNIMVYETGPGYVLRAKTGLTTQGNRIIGWFVGYIEKGDGVWIFANHIETKSYDEGFNDKRIETAKAILKALKVL